MSTAARPRIVLASTSPYRRQLLERLISQFDCAAPNVEEKPRGGETAPQLVQRLAQAKARAVVANYPKALIIAGDQAAALGDEIIGKPGSREAASAQLARFAGQRVCFYSGVCLLDGRDNSCETAVETYSVYFRRLATEEIDAYLDLDQPYDCAGSFKMEAHGFQLFDKMEGDDPNTLVGLPLIRLADMLRRRGYNPLLAHST